jgi:hypothetical protein
VSVSRRTWLRGAGALLAAPLLGSLLPSAGGGTGTPPRRLVVFFVPNGIFPSIWTPAGTGSGWTPSPVLEALAPIRAETAVLTGLANRVGDGDHDIAIRTLLTCEPTSGSSSPASLDQRVAALAGATPLGSIHLASEGEAPCPNGRCTQRNRLSWLAGDVPAPRDTQVDAAWRRLFGVRRLRGSVLDAVREDLGRYRVRAGSQDQRRLDAYTDGLRALEQRAPLPASCAAPEAPRVVDRPLYGDDDHVRTMLDLVVAGLSCDLFRVATYMIGNEGSDRRFDALGLPARHHALSHSPFDNANTTVGRWEVGHFAYLVQRLAEVEEADGSRLLDHTHVLFVGGMGEGDLHRAYDLPVLLAGAGSGLPRGQHRAYGDRPIADLWISVMRAFGQAGSTYGVDGTGALLELG